MPRDDLWYVIVNDMASDLFDLAYTICLWGGLIVALLRYRLYDADAAITRSAVWAIAAPLLAFFFAATIEVLKVALGPVLGNDMVVVPSAGALTAMLIAPVGSWIERRVELWSRRDLIALSRELPAAASDLSENDDAAMLLDHACRAVTRTMKARAAAIAVHAGARWTSRRRVGRRRRKRWTGVARRCRAGRGRGARLSSRAATGLFPGPRRADRAAGRASRRRSPGCSSGRAPTAACRIATPRFVLAEIAPALGRALHVIAARRKRFAALLARSGGKAGRRAGRAAPARGRRKRPKLNTPSSPCG